MQLVVLPITLQTLCNSSANVFTIFRSARSTNVRSENVIFCGNKKLSFPGDLNIYMYDKYSYIFTEHINENFFYV